MKLIRKVTGFILDGDDKFYATQGAAMAASVRDERLSMIRDGVGSKWHSDPVGALLDDEQLLKRVAALKYQAEQEGNE